MINFKSNRVIDSLLKYTNITVDINVLHLTLAHISDEIDTH